MRTKENNNINYIEFKADDLEVVKSFYSAVFGWVFTDFGPTYTAFSNSGINGGFEKIESEIINGVLVVLYHKNLSQIKMKILEFGGTVSHDIFEFPGGWRFHFTDPCGNELAVWSELED